MDELLSYCGLMCRMCPIHVATRELDQQQQLRQREDIASVLNQHYKLNCSAHDVTDCDGCRAVGGRIFAMCSGCDIRKCAIERKLESCAYCPEYACGKLQSQFAKYPQARVRLEEVRFEES